MTDTALSPTLQALFSPTPPEDSLEEELFWVRNELARVQARNELLRYIDALTQAHELDVNMLAFLGHVQRHVCLSGHESYTLRTLAQALGIPPLPLELTQMEATRHAYITSEGKWTGSWRRVILTPAGEHHLKALRRTFQEVLDHTKPLKTGQ